MKLSLLSRRPRNEGNVLLVVLCVALVMGVSLAAVFQYTSSQVNAVARSQSWNEAMVLADAGLEDGMQLLNKYADTGLQPLLWSVTADSDSWKYIGANTFAVQRTLGSNFYSVYITNTGSQPWIRSTGGRVFHGSTSDVRVSRTILVQATTSSLYQGALLAKNGITFGGTVRIDSFNSQNPLYSSNGMYNPLYAKDGGNVATVASNVQNIVVVGGSVDVYGKIYTGPETTVNFNGGGSAGSMTWVDGGNPGYQDGWWDTDLNVDIPDAPAWPGGGVPIPAMGTYLFMGTNYANSRLLTSGSYYTLGALSLNSSDKILVTGNVKLYFTSDFKLGASSEIIIAPNSSLTVWAGGSLDLGGYGVANQTGNATNLTFYGLNTCTSIKLSGGSSFVGTIYAPYATYEQTGGGSADKTLHMIGSVVANTIKLSGHTEVHYDESLEKIPAGPIYYVMSWREI